MGILKSRNDVLQSVMAVCKLWAEIRSKDPATKVGAAIYDGRTGSLHLGYNGFPAGVPDDEAVWNNRREADTHKDRPEWLLTKYDLVIHAEVNAVRKALMAGVILGRVDVALVCTHVPCPQCFKDVVLANHIQTVLYDEDNYASRSPRDKWLLDQMLRLGDTDMIKMEEKS